MDLNRPFGDRVDNDGNSIIDDLFESNDDDYYQPVPGGNEGWQITRGWLPAGFLESRQPGPALPALRARQLYAYHLFNLLESLQETFAFIYPRPSPNPEMLDPGSRLFAIESDDADETDADETDADETDADRAKPPVGLDAALASNVARQRLHTRRVLAQWAVNIVDFLDADAIMTPFRYPISTDDHEPDVGSRRVVWGCEYPDLIITETLAFHDRGIADTDKDDGSGKTTNPPPPRFRMMTSTKSGCRKDLCLSNCTPPAIRIFPSRPPSFSRMESSWMLAGLPRQIRSAGPPYGESRSPVASPVPCCRTIPSG